MQFLLLFFCLFMFHPETLNAGPQTIPEISTVTTGGVKAVLIKPSKPVASIILLAGGDGNIGVLDAGIISRQGNQLVRTRQNYAEKGFAVLVPDIGYNLSELITFMRKIKAPVTVVGTSRGTIRAAQGLKNGAKPDKLVLTSGFLSDASGDRENVINILNDVNLLPKTLIIHHRNDHCRRTSPEGVNDFMIWAQNRAKLIWLEGGDEVGNPCEAQSFHGFLGIDQKVVEKISAFAR
jgi:hypothetical protein